MGPLGSSPVPRGMNSRSTASQLMASSDAEKAAVLLREVRVVHGAAEAHPQRRCTPSHGNPEGLRHTREAAEASPCELHGGRCSLGIEMNDCAIKESIVHDVQDWVCCAIEQFWLFDY